jgi:hypothetical protein
VELSTFVLKPERRPEVDIQPRRFNVTEVREGPERHLRENGFLSAS